MIYLTWKNNTAQYATGELGYRGKMKLFSIYWNASLPHGSTTPRWKLMCYLPGIKDNLGNHEVEQAKKKAEEVFVHWCKLMNVEPKEEATQ